MARVSKADMTEKNPAEWVAGAKAARAARKNVSDQLTKLIESADLTGSRPLVARRIRELAGAQRSGDVAAERAALMELAVAASTSAADIDVRHPALAAAA
jgi:hypothetical protein